MTDFVIKTIPNTPRVTTIMFNPVFSVICSIGKAPFYGGIEIQFEPADKLLEFESFEKWLHSLANNQMTIEDLARLAFDKLTDALGDIPLRIAVHARTTVHAPVSAIIERRV